MEVEQRLYSVSKAAKILGVIPRTIRAWDATGKIKVVLSPSGRRMIQIEEINRILGNLKYNNIK
jgi:putative resolvase